MRARWPIAVAAAFALHAAPALAAPGWTAPLDLGAGAEPAIGAAGDGTATVVWQTTADEVFFAARPTGGSFGGPVRLSAAGAEAGGPALAVNAGGSAVAAWVGDAGATSIDTAAGAGGTLAPAGAVPSPGDEPSDVKVGIDGAGRQWIVWLHELPAGSRVRVARRDPGGPLTLVGDVSAVGASDLSLAVGASGAAFATWALTTVAGDVVRTHIEQADLAAGGPATLVAQGELEPVGGDDVGDVVGGPRAALTTDGQLLLAWLREVTAAGDPAVTEIRANAASGPVAQTLGSVPTLDVAAGSAGIGVIAWDERVSTAVNSVRAAVRPSGAFVGPPATLATGGPGAAVSDPRAAVRAGGEAVVTWRRQGVGVEASAGGGPAAPVTGGEGGPALLSPDGEGNVAAAWELDPGPASNDEQIRVAAYDAAGPRLSALSAPASVEVGQTASFGVTAVDTWSALAGIDWTFGDGGMASGAAVTHVYGSAGRFAVGATARDALANATAAEATVAVGEAPPAATPTPAPPPPPAADTTPPQLTGLRPVERCVRSGAPAFALTLSEPARVRFILRRRVGSPGVRRCPAVRGRQPGSATPVDDQARDLPGGDNTYTTAVTARARTPRRLRAGRSVVRVLAQSRLRPGTYQLIARATDAAGNGAPDVITKVWILRR